MKVSEVCQQNMAKCITRRENNVHNFSIFFYARVYCLRKAIRATHSNSDYVIQEFMFCRSVDRSSDFTPSCYCSEFIPKQLILITTMQEVIKMCVLLSCVTNAPTQTRQHVLFILRDGHQVQERVHRPDHVWMPWQLLHTRRAIGDLGRRHSQSA